MRVLSFVLLVSLALAAASSARANSSVGTPTQISVLMASSIQWALAQIESGHLKNPDAAKGSSGEVSRFQIMPEVWREYTRSRNYSNPAVAWSVAYRILRDRELWFTRATGRQPTPFDLYVMWNKPGLYEQVRFNPRRLPSRLRDVARRFENLVETLE